MIERPLPFFGAGGEAAAITLGLLFVAQNIAGLLSITMLAAIAMSVGFTWLIKEFRDIDQFGPESFVIGVTTPSSLKAGYEVDEKPGTTYSSFD
jgi:hypothetical protein